MQPLLWYSFPLYQGMKVETFQFEHLLERVLCESLSPLPWISVKIWDRKVAHLAFTVHPNISDDLRTEICNSHGNLDVGLFADVILALYWWTLVLCTYITHCTEESFCVILSAWIMTAFLSCKRKVAVLHLVTQLICKSSRNMASRWQHWFRCYFVAT
jgi:hypothetical protein